MSDDDCDFGRIVKGVTVTKIEDDKIMGMYESQAITLHDGKYGKYLKHKGANYSLPGWAKQDDDEEKLDLIKCMKIIDYKRKKRIS